jgi:UDP-N-acetyl-D-mannosaminuronic acid dehydrogenase
MSVIGLGYVGLPTAVVFASKGSTVIGVDVDASKVKAVNDGECYIREPGLAELLRNAVSKGLLRATTDAVIIAVPTPLKG